MSLSKIRETWNFIFSWKQHDQQSRQPLSKEGTSNNSLETLTLSENEANRIRPRESSVSIKSSNPVAPNESEISTSHCKSRHREGKRDPVSRRGESLQLHSCRSSSRVRSRAQKTLPYTVRE